MKHDKAIALLEHHANNCEQNAVIQEREGQYEDAANSRTNAADYRAAIDSLRPDPALPESWAVKMQATVDGKYVAAGIGVGIQSANYCEGISGWLIGKDGEFQTG